jgi:protocatechuate 3,4-dioxygenase beta subunit
LWLAPSRLHGEIELTDAVAEPACFVADDGTALPHALLNLRAAEGTPSRPRWERTDAQGCLALTADPGRYQVTLYPLGKDRLERELLRVDPADMPPVLGACDGCEAVYDGRPAHIGSSTRLAAVDEPGERLRLQGRVLGADGEPAVGVQLYAYQTDHAGSYPSLDGVGAAASRHGRLRGWTVSDAQGHYRFDTVRPGSYPGSTVPQHIHMHVIEPGRCTYYLDDVRFADDPHMPGEPAHRAPRGGNGLSRPEQSADGDWRVQRDIHLGLNVADYADCGSGQT